MSERKLARLTRLHRLLALLTGEIDAYGYTRLVGDDLTRTLKWLGISPSQLFRDLRYLESQGYIRRGHGFIQRGATP